MARVVAALILFFALFGTATANDLSTCTDGSGDAAVAACTRALESARLNRTDRVRAYNSRGILWKRKGDYDRAIADYTAAIELNRNYLFAYYNRGNSYLEKQNFDRAIADFAAAIRINPKYSQAYANRGVAYGEKQDYDRALADYNIAIQLDPEIRNRLQQSRRRSEKQG